MLSLCIARNAALPAKAGPAGFYGHRLSTWDMREAEFQRFKHRAGLKARH
jgi:hypothetical protein